MEEIENKKKSKKAIIALITIFILVITLIIILLNIFTNQKSSNETNINNAKIEKNEVRENSNFSNDFKDSTNEVIKEMTKMEINAFNSTWIGYEGKQTGVQIKSLISRLISNLKMYQDEPEKILKVRYIDQQNKEKTLNNSGNINTLENELNSLYSEVKAKYMYDVKFEYSENKVIERIIIKYIGEK